MTRQAQVGAFALLALLLLFGVFYVITDFGTRHTGYRIGVHFQGAAGLHSGAIVYFSGVTVGTVDSISLLPDNSVDVILAVNRDVDIPKASRFLIQAPLTGDPNLLIVPPVGRPEDVQMLDRRVLAVRDQPQGETTATIADLLEQGQGEVKRLDTMLASLEAREPKLLDTLQTTLDNANQLTSTMNRTVQQVSAQFSEIGDTLQSSLTTASRNIVDLTGTLNDTARLNSTHVNNIIAQFDSTSAALDKSMNALQGLATDPNLKGNILAATKNIADTTAAIAGMSQDLRTVTSNPQTQAQIRNTIANLDATMQRANSLMGQLGGKSSVYGVDAAASPFPIPARSGPSVLPSAYPDVPMAQSPVVEQSGGQAVPAPTIGQMHLKSRLASIAKDLISIQVRIAGLDAQQHCCYSPLLSGDRGPQTDINAVLLPQASTSLMVGANDIGYHTTANVAILRSFGENVKLGGGVLYSQLGVLGQYNAQTFGLETRVYDPRRPALDLYGSLRLLPGVHLFFGQRDANHTDRRNVYGIQIQQ